VAAETGPQHIVQRRPSDPHEGADRRPQAAEVDVAQRVAVLVVVPEPADDGAGSLDGGGDAEAAQRPHGVGLHRQAGPWLIPAGAAFDQIDLPGALAQSQVKAQARDPAPHDEHPPGSQRPSSDPVPLRASPYEGPGPQARTAENTNLDYCELKPPRAWSVPGKERPWAIWYRRGRR
jgi:hypothetical protein